MANKQTKNLYFRNYFFRKKELFNNMPNSFIAFLFYILYCSVKLHYNQ